MRFNEKFDLLKLFPEVEMEFKKPSRLTSMNIPDPTVKKLKRLETRIERLLSEEEIKMFISKLRERPWFLKHDLMSFVSDVEDKLRDKMIQKTFEVIEEFKIKDRIYRIGDILYIADHFQGSACDSFAITLLNKRTNSGKRIDSHCGCYVIEDNIKRSDEEKKLADIQIRTDRFDI